MINCLLAKQRVYKSILLLLCNQSCDELILMAKQIHKEKYFQISFYGNSTFLVGILIQRIMKLLSLNKYVMMHTLIQYQSNWAVIHHVSYNRSLFAWTLRKYMTNSLTMSFLEDLTKLFRSKNLKIILLIQWYW